MEYPLLCYYYDVTPKFQTNQYEGFFYSRQFFCERNGSESRPHSSPDPSCGREISRGKTKNPFPQKNEAGCGQEFLSKKVRANAKITPPNETLSELRKRSDFAGAKIALSIFSKPFPPTAEAVNSQSSPQLKS